MDNYYKAQLKQNQNKQRPQSHKPTHADNIRANNSLRRREDFLNSNNKTIKVTQNGTIPLCNLQNHAFRDRQKEKELNKTGVTVKNYKKQNERVEYNQQQNLNAIQDRQLYQQFAPDANFRQRQKKLEGEVFKQGKVQNEKLRIDEILDKNQVLDSSEKNMNIWHYQNFRQKNKNKNILKEMKFENQKQYFIEYQSEPYDKPCEYKIYYPDQEFNKRDKSKEQNRFEFISTVAEDQFGKAQNQSNSIRTHHQDQILNIEPYCYNFAKNKKINTNYKKALVDTHAVDNIFPFQHSQNKNGRCLKNSKPQSAKIYKTSIQQYVKNQNNKKSNKFQNTNIIYENQNEDRNVTKIKNDDDLIELYFQNF